MTSFFAVFAGVLAAEVVVGVFKVAVGLWLRRKQLDAFLKLFASVGSAEEIGN
jgi:hypothetical protein